VRSLRIADLAAVVRGLCERFPNHGIALKSIAKLVVTAIRTHETDDIFAPTFLPFVAEKIRSKEKNRGMHAFVIDCARKLVARAESEPDVAETLGKFPEFAEDCIPAVERYESVIGLEFG
jgi:hypothetical protein